MLGLPGSLFPFRVVFGTTIGILCLFSYSCSVDTSKTTRMYLMDLFYVFIYTELKSMISKNKMAV